MATFAEIVAQSEKDRHKVYFLQAGKNKYFAPKPVKVNPVKELARLRDDERRERAAKMAQLYQGDETPLDTLLPEPKHITQADGGLPLMVSLLRRVITSRKLVEDCR
jgi:hypothetical protein